MYNYNLVNPVNITYRKPQGQNPLTGSEENARYDGGHDDSRAPINFDDSKNQRQFPNGSKVQVDYTKNKINIAQIVEDFKSTIAAINAPEEVSDEVNLYLALVDKESTKEKPSREIILSNLKNASKVSDKYIEESLKKPSKVVEDWVDALFLQNIDLKSNPHDINEAYRVQIPKKTNANIEPLADDVFTPSVLVNDDIISQNVPNPYSQNTDVLSEVSNNIFETGMPLAQPAIEQNSTGQSSALQMQDFHSQNAQVQNSEQQVMHKTAEYVRLAQKTSDNYIQNENEPEIDFKQMEAQLQIAEAFSASKNTQEPAKIEANQIYKLQAENVQQNKTTYSTQIKKADTGVTQSIVEPVSHVFSSPVNDKAKSVFVKAKRLVKSNGDPYNALKLYDEALKLIKDSEDTNLKAAIFFERGRVFDDYDYVEYALKDYNKATNSSDYNLKTHAHLKMGRIYDDYVMFDPAMEQYTCAIDSSEAANNPYGKTKALRYIASMFADRFDKENTTVFSELAVDSSYETKNPKTVAKTYNDTAKNFEYIGETKMALNNYGKAVKTLGSTADYSTLAQNYQDASELMEKIGNSAKAQSLLSKARYYHQKAQLSQS